MAEVFHNIFLSDAEDPYYTLSMDNLQNVQHNSNLWENKLENMKMNTRT